MNEDFANTGKASRLSEIGTANGIFNPKSPEHNVANGAVAIMPVVAAQAGNGDAHLDLNQALRQATSEIRANGDCRSLRITMEFRPGKLSPLAPGAGNGLRAHLLRLIRSIVSVCRDNSLLTLSTDSLEKYNILRISGFEPSGGRSPVDESMATPVNGLPQEIRTIVHELEINCGVQCEREQDGALILFFTNALSRSIPPRQVTSRTRNKVKAN